MFLHFEQDHFTSQVARLSIGKQRREQPDIDALTGMFCDQFNAAAKDKRTKAGRDSPSRHSQKRILAGRTLVNSGQLIV